MRKKILSLLAMTILCSSAILAIDLFPRANAVQVQTSSLELHLFAPTTASPGQVISIGLWTIFENATFPGGGRADLAFNNTSVAGNTTLSFTVKINLGIAVGPHIHTPTGSLTFLAPFKQWGHPGAWTTSYTVPSDLGLYGVHMYANYTYVNPRGAATSYIAQAQTTFNVQATGAAASDVSGLANTSYAILGLAAVADVLGLLLLFWKRTPAKA